MYNLLKIQEKTLVKWFICLLKKQFIVLYSESLPKCIVSHEKTYTAMLFKTK